MPDESMPGVLGEISGIMQGIVNEATLAISSDDDYIEDPEDAAHRYRDALETILKGAARAEGLWSEYINRELPEHKDINQ